MGYCNYGDLVKVGGYTDTRHIKRLLDTPDLKAALVNLGWDKVNKSQIPDSIGSGNKRLVNWELYKK